MTAVEVSRVYRELQIKGALVAEKERAVANRRAALAELRQQVDIAQRECQQRQAPLTQELGRLNAAKDECASVKADRDRAARAQQLKLTQLKDDERTLQSQTQELLTGIQRAVEKVHFARQDAAQTDAVDDAIARFESQVRAEEETLTAFEARVDELEASSSRRRHGTNLPQLNLSSEPHAHSDESAHRVPVQPHTVPSVAPSQVRPADAPVDIPAGNTVVFFDEE
uniref:Uncharacterized protein n=1 Tax=Neobodo designis TaxID=312471 RepID=A0A7S1Q4W4_NEODS